MEDSDKGKKFEVGVEKEILSAWHIFENTAEGIIMTDNRGRIVNSNPAIEKLFGYTSDFLLGKTIEILMPDEVSAKHKEHRDSYFAKPYSRPLLMGSNLRGKKADGSIIPLHISLSSFVENGETFAVAFISDRTELTRKEEQLVKNQNNLKQLTDELKVLNSQLEKRVQKRTQMLEETIAELNDAQIQLKISLEKERELGDMKSKFASLVSHEFRTPLATILSSLNLIERYSQDELNSNQQKHVFKIKKSVQSMVDIINDLLTITRIENRKLEYKPIPIGVKQFMDNVVADFQKFLKPGQSISLNCQATGDIVTDPNLLSQVVNNLLTNAIKFSDENTIINLGVQHESDVLNITVEDKGVGIPEEDLHNLFDSFYRASNVSSIEGTGLGLFIVKKCLELLGGEIKVSSVLNKGTTVKIKIKEHTINDEKNTGN
jgi:PAS domain S-box-containing protein